MRSQILDAVSTVQYDTATLPAQQLGVRAPLEPHGGDSEGDSLPFTFFRCLYF